MAGLTPNAEVTRAMKTPNETANAEGVALIAELDLLPCPFCGRKPIIFRRDIGLFDIRCETFDCYLEAGANWYLSAQEVAEKWNKRKSNI